jgi:hypothetical protein
MIDIQGFSEYLKNNRKYPNSVVLKYVAVIRKVVDSGFESVLMTMGPHELAVMTIGHPLTKSMRYTHWRPGIKRYREFVEWSERQERMKL